MLNFSKNNLYEINIALKNEVSLLKNNEILEFITINPDLFSNKYNGSTLQIKSEIFMYHSHKTFLDLSEYLMCKYLTSKILDDNFIIIRYQKLNNNVSFHNSTNSNEKYGTNSEFFNINKNEEMSFLSPYLHALNNVNISKRFKILNLGISTGDEFEILKSIINNINNYELIGVDYCKSAINYANNKNTNTNTKFIHADINDLDNLKLGKFDLIISIGTLQSSSLNFKLIFNNLVQNYLKSDSSIILGFPNCRWIDGSMIYGAKMKNYSVSDMSLLIKDIHYCKKYLQQKKYKVNVSGKDYMFLSANKIISSDY